MSFYSHLFSYYSIFGSKKYFKQISDKTPEIYSGPMREKTLNWNYSKNYHKIFFKFWIEVIQIPETNIFKKLVC